MRSLTDRRNNTKICSVALVIVVFLFSGISLGETVVTGNKNIVIKGTSLVKLSDLGAIDTIDVRDEALIHLPVSVKNVFVEKYEFPTSEFKDELGAYTIQQAIFWIVATLALGSAVSQR